MPNALGANLRRVTEWLTAFGCENPTIAFTQSDVVVFKDRRPINSATGRNLMLETIKDFSPITALKLAAFRQAMSDNYRNVLSKKVFCETIITGKEGLRLRKTLANEEANTVLDVVWKESIYVSSENIMEAGYDGKTFSGDITCYSLGLLFAEDKNKVSAAVARIRNIVLAGCDYGLISRNRINSKNAPVRCERLLHDMMIELAVYNSDATRQLNLQLGWDLSHLSQKLTTSHNWRS